MISAEKSMNPEILRNLLIEEMGRTRADALLERFQLMSAAAHARAEAEAQRTRADKLQADTAARGEPDGSWPTDSAAEIDPRRAPHAGETAR